MLQSLMTTYNKNSVNGCGDDVSMLSVEKQNADFLEGTNFLLCVCVFKFNSKYFIYDFKSTVIYQLKIIF